MDDTGYDKTRESVITLDIQATTSQLPQSGCEHPDPPLSSYPMLPMHKFFGHAGRGGRLGNELCLDVMMTDECKTSLLTNQ